MMDQFLNQYSAEIRDKACKIKALVFDVDGVLTDGSVIYSEFGDEVKSFNVKDGQIIKHLIENDILVGAITGRKSKLVERRCKELKLDFLFQGVGDKVKVLKTVIEEYKLNEEEIAYIGDDLVDLGVLKMAGLSVCPTDAIQYVKSQVDIVAEKEGGRGVVREVGDLILVAKGKLEDVIKGYES